MEIISNQNQELTDPGRPGNPQHCEEPASGQPRAGRSNFRLSKSTSPRHLDSKEEITIELKLME
jgi:hypothetical protein